MSDHTDGTDEPDDFDAKVIDLIAKKIVHGLEQHPDAPHDRRVLMVKAMLAIVYDMGGTAEGEEWKP